MKERQPTFELSEQFQLNLAYFNFIRLAQAYGSDPAKKPDSLDPELSPLLNENTRTLRVLVPPDYEDQKHSDLISGIDYGANAVEIFYRKGDDAAKITLRLNEKAGLVKMHTDNVFTVVHPEEQDKNYHTYDPVDKTKVRPNIKIITELLKKAEEVLEKQEKEKFASRFDKPKTTIRQRLSRRIEGFLE